MFPKKINCCENIFRVAIFRITIVLHTIRITV